MVVRLSSTPSTCEETPPNTRNVSNSTCVVIDINRHDIGSKLKVWVFWLLFFQIKRYLICPEKKNALPCHIITTTKSPTKRFTYQNITLKLIF